MTKPEMIDRVIWTVALVSVVGAVVLLFWLWPTQGSDLYMHMVVGRWTWAHSDVPRVDVFSFVTPGSEFIAHSWLSGLALYAIDEGLGLPGMRLVRVALIGLALAWSAYAAKTIGAPWPAVMLLTPLVLFVMWGRLELRPLLLTSVLLAAQLCLLVRVHTGQWSWRALWALPPLYILWVNGHGGWVQGFTLLFVVTGAVGLMALRRRWTGTGGASALSLYRLLPVVVACGLAVLVNPYGVRGVTFTFTIQQSWIRESTLEWQSPFMNEIWGLKGGGKYVPVSWVFYGYLALLGGVLLVAGRRWRTTDLVPLAVMSFWGAMSLRYVRTASDTMLLTAPFVAAALRPLVARAPRGVMLGGLLGTLAVALLGTSVMVMAGMLRSIPIQAGVGTLLRNELACVTTIVERYALTGRFMTVFNPHRIVYLYPDRFRVPVTWDYVAGPVHYEAFLAAGDHPEMLLAYLTRYHVDAVLLSYRAAVREHRDAVIPRTVIVLKAHGWVVVHIENFLVLLVPNRPDLADLIRREGYRWLPASQEPPRTPQHAEEIIEEATRMGQCPWASQISAASRAYALTLLGRHQEAQEARAQAPGFRAGPLY